MEDIIYKLSLLSYETKFCKARSFKPISKIFFAHKEAEKVNKFEYMYEMSYWLMGLIGSKRLGVYLPFSNFAKNLNSAA